jgi:pantoate--beta-alanine ligase
VYLTADERAAAPVLHRALLAGRAAILAGERDPASVEATMAEVLAGEPLVAPDYVVAVDAVTLHRPDVLRDEVRLLVAGRLGKPRLLDNLGVTIPSD